MKDILLDEFKCDDKLLLEKAFNKHCEVLSYGKAGITNSGLNPMCILAVHFYIQRFSPTLFHPDSDSENESDLESISETEYIPE
jgi:hypothetical protein